MARVTVEDCLEHIVDQFALVHLASTRYRQLHRGAVRLVDNKNKDIVCALREIAAQRVRFRENVGEVLQKSHSKLASAQMQGRMDAGDMPAAPGLGSDESENPTPLI